jgi:hypothetical protein
MRDLIEWYAGLSPWLRFGVAGFFLVVAAVALLVFDRFWPWAWGVGIVLLLFAFPNSAQERLPRLLRPARRWTWTLLTANRST